MKNEKNVLVLRVREPWEVSRGHAPHRSGAGTHVSDPKRKRTRLAQVRAAIKDQY
jgi:rhodanese-related sulfurtransferase